MKRQLATALALTLATAFANPASATAMYFADAFAEVIIVDITGTSPGSDIFVDGDAFLSFGDSDSFGTGMVGSSGITADFFGDGFVIDASVSGSASPPLGGAFSELGTDAFLSFENISSTETYSIELAISAGAFATASVMDPFNEDAFAEGFAVITLDFDPVLLIDIVADGLFGPAADGDSAADTLTITLGPGEFAEVGAIADVFGLAIAFDVPEPGTLALGLFGLLGMRRLRSRR